MSMRKKVKFTASLILTASMLWSCSSVTYSECPVFPKGGESVGAELENVPYQNFENFWEWIGRLDKLRQELELCRPNSV